MNVVIRIRYQKNDSQYNGQRETYSRRNNDLQRHAQKTKDRVR